MHARSLNPVHRYARPASPGTSVLRAAVLAIVPVVVAAVSAPAVAAPQVLGLVATRSPVPLVCDGVNCSADLSTFCLQQWRRAPHPGQRYVAHAEGAGIHVLGMDAGGAVRDVANGAVLEIEAPRGVTAVTVRVPQRILDRHGVTRIAVSVDANVSLVPVAAPRDPYPQSAEDIAIATGPLRELATRFVDDNVAGVVAADALNRAITLIPRGVSSLSPRLNDRVWAEVAASLPSGDEVHRAGLAAARDAFDRCHDGGGSSLTGRNTLSLDECLAKRQQGLIEPLNRGYWDGTKTGS
jgi:hypothetical protein